MSKIISFDDIKTCLQNVKTYIDTKYAELKAVIDTRVPQTQICKQNGGQGLVKIKDLSGIKVSSDGTISIDPATTDDITRQVDNCKPITPKYLSETFKAYGIEDENYISSINGRLTALEETIKGGT